VFVACWTLDDEEESEDTGQHPMADRRRRPY
jgi:hypothetical protein